METKTLIIKAREKGITIKLISELTGIKLHTLYQYNSGLQGLSEEKEQKIRNLLELLLEL